MEKIKALINKIKELINKIMKTKRARYIAIIASVLVVALTVVLVVVLTTPPPPDGPGTTETDGPLSPDYPLPPVDSGADSMQEEDTGKLEESENGGAIGLTYMVDAEVDLSTGNIDFLFGNPSRSNQNIIVAISVQDNIIARSGLLLPGYQLTDISMSDEGKAKLTQPGVYEGKFVVESYDPESGEKAIINVEIPITITAK